MPGSTSTSADFALEYTGAERRRLMLLALTGVTVMLLASRLWFFPWLAAFAATAGCRGIAGLNGLTLLFHGLFAGLPLLLGWPGYRALRSGQFPAAGVKVLLPTRIRRGRARQGAAAVLPRPCNR